MRTRVFTILTIVALASCTPPTPTPTPEVAPASSSLIAPVKAPIETNIIFGPESAEISAIQLSILEALSQRAKEADVQTIEVIGHTDTLGTANANQALSERRALSVVNALEANGVPLAKISPSGRGESEPLLDTGDGVREIRNNRVTVTIRYTNTPPTQ
ncbi:MAG: OmpA family protein [Pseudomonadota bacterium]